MEFTTEHAGAVVRAINEAAPRLSKDTVDKIAAATLDALMAVPAPEFDAMKAGGQAQDVVGIATGVLRTALANGFGQEAAESMAHQTFAVNIVKSSGVMGHVGH